MYEVGIRYAVRLSPVAALIIEGAGRRWMFTDDFVIGRRAPAGLVIDDEYLSPLHARCTCRGGVWAIEDLGTTNGTWAGGGPLSGGWRVHGLVPIGKGTRIRVGRTDLTFVPA
jgi:pSer/pThr/pTyr-binding forkhead associated (FHA) protein